MPRAAIISWDATRGVAVLCAGENSFFLEYSNDMEKNGQKFAELCRFLQVISPNLPPLEPFPRRVPDGPLPEVTPEELATAQKFTHATAARGLGRRTKYESREARMLSSQEILDIIDDL